VVLWNFHPLIIAINMATKRDCSLCNEQMEDAPAVHDLTLCEKTERLKGRVEIKKLKESVRNWQDAWFNYRDIVGKLHWHHEAIISDEQRVYYQNNLKQIAEKE